MRSNLLLIFCVLSFFVLGCGNFFKEMTNSALDKANANRPSPPTIETKTNDGYVASETGTEKEKPAAGRSNVQGKAVFNEKPAAGVEVKLCQKFGSVLI